MRIEIKLYSYHDLDLVSLYKTGRIAFPETTRQVLNSYARKEVYKVRPLPLNENRAAQLRLMKQKPNLLIILMMKKQKTLTIFWMILQSSIDVAA